MWGFPVHKLSLDGFTEADLAGFEVPEGPSIQSMPSEQIRNQLIEMTDGLQQAQELIAGAEMRARRAELAHSIAHVYRQTCDKHHVRF